MRAITYACSNVGCLLWSWLRRGWKEVIDVHLSSIRMWRAAFAFFRMSSGVCSSWAAQAAALTSVFHVWKLFIWRHRIHCVDILETLEVRPLFDFIEEGRWIHVDLLVERLLQRRVLPVDLPLLAALLRCGWSAFPWTELTGTLC